MDALFRLVLPAASHVTSLSHRAEQKALPWPASSAMAGMTCP